MSRRVLVVDDHPPVVIIIRKVLEGGGFLSTSSYKRDGEWVEGNSITYVEQK